MTSRPSVGRLAPRSRGGSQGGSYIHPVADRFERAALAVLRLLRGSYRRRWGLYSFQRPAIGSWRCEGCREIGGGDGFADLNWMQHRDSGQDGAAWCWVVAVCGGGELTR